MKLKRFLALMALVPAAFNISPASAAARTALAVPLCTGDGVARTISVPLGQQDVPGKQVPGCCTKGCHASERKRSKRCC